MTMRLRSPAVRLVVLATLLTQPALSQSTKVEGAKGSSKPEPAKAEATKAEPKKAESGKPDAAKPDPAKQDSKAEPSKPESAKRDSTNDESTKRDSTKDDEGAKAASSKTDGESGEDSSAAEESGLGSAAPVDPDRGSGTRSVPAQPQPEPRAPTPAEKPKSHRTGPAPAKPRPTLPEGAARAKPNGSARRVIAGGLTSEEIELGTTDPELRALREADKVLFPKPLRGLTPGFRWDLPRPVERDAPELSASGVPPRARLPEEVERLGAADAEWLRGLLMPNLPVRLESRVVRYLKFYRDSAKGRAIARAWAKKSGRYIPALKEELARAGLPTDLAWLSLIESGHNPLIISPAGAGGLWQFMPETARLYGLTVDRWVDERLDPQRSTEAAIRFLSDLHRRFGNWELAMAGYNMGYGGLSRAIRKYNSNDFWELCSYEGGVPWETTLYVPKIAAIAIVMANPKAFGLSDIEPDAPLSFDVVNVAPGMSLEAVARAADVTPETIAELNRHLLASRVPPLRPDERARRWQVKVPRGKGQATLQRLAKLDHDLVDEYESYVVRPGETCEALAQGRGISEAELRRINGMSSREALTSGALLLLPRQAKSAEAAPRGGTAADEAGEVTVVAPRPFSYPNRRRVFYRLAGGDTLGRVASLFGVTRSELLTWNALDPTARLHSGMVLQVFVDEKKRLDHVRYVKEHDTRVLVAGTQAFFDHFEAQNGKKRIVVQVREGDTLSGIGKRYGMSVGSMERVNRFSRTKKLRPGDQIVVYAPRSMPGNADEEEIEPAPLPPPEPPRPDALPSLSDLED